MQHTIHDKFSIVLLHKHYDPDHLLDVIAQMRTLGTPTIRAVCTDPDGVYVALEGCHRIRAAKILGLVPVIDEVGYSAVVIEGCDGGRGYTAAEIVDDAWQQPEIIEFGDIQVD